MKKTVEGVMLAYLEEAPVMEGEKKGIMFWEKGDSGWTEGRKKLPGDHLGRLKWHVRVKSALFRKSPREDRKTKKKVLKN